MAKVAHHRLKSEKITTRFGEFSLDLNGHFEVSEDVAKQLCDPLLYGSTFKMADPKAKKEVEVTEKATETPTKPDIVLPAKSTPVKPVVQRGRPKKS